jgi:radical SAM protein with 4Fe4S-binding SPASM domain
MLDEVDLYVTMACNLSCDFCSVRANEHRRAALPLARLLRLVEEARALGMEQLHLTGGEPTLRPDLEELVHHATDLGVETRLITNGTLLDSTRLQRLQEAGLRSIMISVDGLESTHDAMRGVPGAWGRAMACAREAVALGYRTRLSAVAFRHNYAELPSLMRRAAGMGAHIFSVFLGSPLGRGEAWRERVLTPEEWRAFLETLRERTGAGGFGEGMELIVEQGFLWPDSTGYDRGRRAGRGTGCSTLLTSYDYLIVRGDGNLYQCVFFLHDGEALGNVAERPLAEVLAQARVEARYAPFTESGPTCRACPHEAACRGGCRGYAFLYTGDWHRPDPRCTAKPVSVDVPYLPLCPIAKLNLRTGFIGGSSEQALAE